MDDLWPLPVAIAAAAASAVVLLLAGPRLVGVVDRIADRTGLGEALAGAILLGATTSLPGLVTSVTAAWVGEAEIAVSNCIGGIAAQTMFLALVDLRYRRANLEHAAASLPNLLQTMLLVGLLAVVLLGALRPGVAVGHVHVATLALPLAYVLGVRAARQVRERPMWRPRTTDETRPDVPDEAPEDESAVRTWLSFAALAVVVAATGWALARSGIAIAHRTGASGTLVGAFLTAVVTSLPELVTALAAVRAGALTLAVADIVGGNTFDVLFVAASDLAYRDGSIYGAIGGSTTFLLVLAMLMTSVLAAGMVVRDRRGIGFEGALLLALYALGLVTTATW